MPWKGERRQRRLLWLIVAVSSAAILSLVSFLTGRATWPGPGSSYGHRRSTADNVAPNIRTLRSIDRFASVKKEDRASRRGMRRRGLEGRSGSSWSKGRDLLTVYEKLLARGHKLFHVGRPKRATRMYKRALRLIDADSRAWWAIGRALHDRGRNRKAVRYLERALALDPASSMAHLVLGSIWQEEKNLDAAGTSYGTYLVLTPAGEHSADVRVVSKKISARNDTASVSSPPMVHLATKFNSKRGTELGAPSSWMLLPLQAGASVARLGRR